MGSQTSGANRTTIYEDLGTTEMPTDRDHNQTGNLQSRESPKRHGRGRGRGDPKAREGRGSRGVRGRKKEMGRADWSKNSVDKRARNTQNQRAAKKRELNGEKQQLPIYATQFSKEEVEAQERKPKRKVAVLIGYSGSGYKGMQLNHHEKTIEGDLFAAFVAAGAISKANADNPKKSSLVRCARTDKGVHAAGNLISLKLIVEDLDIVAKINEQLTPQIRVWGIERTNGSFSAYQFCDSRIYEYLIPTHCFIPPHPQSFLAKQLVELAEEANDLEGYLTRQEEVADIWAEMEEKYVKSVIEGIDPVIRDLALKAFYEHNQSVRDQDPTPVTEEQKGATREISPQGQIDSGVAFASIACGKDKPPTHAAPSPLEIAIRLLKSAYITAKKAYRIHPARLARVRSALSRFEGTHKYHNYTIYKTFRDPSAKRIIKSFVVGEKPIIINNTEWLSLKVHGQSFMMHQIRKMVSMVALLIRCGCHEGRLQDSWETERISIPKAPALGLLLERPVFDAYNEQLEKFGRERINFGRYGKEIEEFKQREIYERIFRVEDSENVFHSLFTGLDNTQSSQLLYLSSVGIDATKREINREGVGEYAEKVKIEDVDSDEEGGDGEEG